MVRRSTLKLLLFPLFPVLHHFHVSPFAWFYPISITVWLFHFFPAVIGLYFDAASVFCPSLSSSQHQLAVFVKPLIKSVVSSRSCHPPVCADGWLLGRLSCVHHVQHWLEWDVAEVNQFVMSQICWVHRFMNRFCGSSAVFFLTSLFHLFPMAPETYCCNIFGGRRNIVIANIFLLHGDCFAFILRPNHYLSCYFNARLTQ